MNDALVVGRLKRVDDLLRDRERLVEWYGPFRSAVGQRWSLD